MIFEKCFVNRKCIYGSLSIERVIEYVFDNGEEISSYSQSSEDRPGFRMMIVYISHLLCGCSFTCYFMSPILIRLVVQALAGYRFL